MILESFEIENWSCIKKLVVSDLPQSGVIVLHGPNGTGKSSIIEALRACLMDYKSDSTSKKLTERWFPKNSTAKPLVRIVFRAQETYWRITKQFKSKESTLESRNASGVWNVVANTASESHERLCAIVGSTDSRAGLHQLLWLTQAEFRLPDKNTFDGGVQSNLRNALGVLQTEGDDHFRVKIAAEWASRFSARSKLGKEPDLKDSSPLAKHLTRLNEYADILSTTEVEYAEVKQLMQRAARLEVNQRNLKQQLVTKLATRNAIQEEYEQSQIRIVANRSATERLANANEKLALALLIQDQRDEKEVQVLEAVEAEKLAFADSENKGRLLREAEQELRDLQESLIDLRREVRSLQSQKDRVDDFVKIIDHEQKTESARADLQEAERIINELDVLQEKHRDQLAPDDATLSKLEANRVAATTLRANLEAATFTLELIPQPGTSAIRLTVDGGSSKEIFPTIGSSYFERAIQRRVILEISDWGRAEITRGSDSRSLEQLQSELALLDATFAKEAATYGISNLEDNAIQSLRDLVADRRVRLPVIEQRQSDLDRIAPKGIEGLRTDLSALEIQLVGTKPRASSSSGEDELPEKRTELESLSATLKTKIDAHSVAITTIEGKIATKQKEIDGEQESPDSVRSKKSKGTEPRQAKQGLRARADDARAVQTSAEATARLLRDQLAKMKTCEEIVEIVQGCRADVATAQDELDQTKLSSNEETVKDRLQIAREAVESVQEEERINERELNQTTAVIGTKAGLHQRRAEAKSRVEEYTRLTDRERLEGNAYHRLMELFEDCREKQFSTVMKPIHNRLLGWMKLLGINNYQSLQFNEQCLPEKLTVREGAFDLPLVDESHGTQEQIGIMVRLALGSTLSTQDDPVVAVLDDPLTHGDAARLDGMRSIFRRAADGDVSISPPAGPLQILVFTCHPERFRTGASKVIDLEKPETMTRSP